MLINLFQSPLAQHQLGLSYLDDRADDHLAVHSLHYLSALPTDLFQLPHNALTAQAPLLPRIGTLPVPSPVAGWLDINLGAYLSRGRLWDVFAGVIVSFTGSESSAESGSGSGSRSDRTSSTSTTASTNSSSWSTSHAAPSPSPNTLVAVKMTCLSAFGGGGRSENETYTEEDVRRGVMKEWRAYRGPLKSLQGSVVPRYLELYAGLAGEGEKCEVWTAVMSHAGKPVEVDKLSDEDK